MIQNPRVRRVIHVTAIVGFLTFCDHSNHAQPPAAASPEALLDAPTKAIDFDVAVFKPNKSVGGVPVLNVQPASESPYLIEGGTSVQCLEYFAT